MKKLLQAAFYCPHFILIILGAISLFALTAALISQYVFGMHPCILCLYQRIPYAVVILMSVMGLISLSYMPKKFVIFNIAICAIAFFINSAIAFYHVGVEQGWWVSGCSVPNFVGMNAQDIVKSLTVTDMPRCDEIPWQLFGLSMAAYNVIFCFILGVYAGIATFTLSKKLTSTPPKAKS